MSRAAGATGRLSSLTVPVPGGNHPGAGPRERDFIHPHRIAFNQLEHSGKLLSQLGKGWAERGCSEDWTAYPAYRPHPGSATAPIRHRAVFTGPA